MQIVGIMTVSRWVISAGKRDYSLIEWSSEYQSQILSPSKCSLIQILQESANKVWNFFLHHSATLSPDPPGWHLTQILCLAVRKCTCRG